MRPSLSFAAVALAATIAPAPTIEDNELRLVEVAAIVPLEGQAGLLLLKAKDSGEILPLVIGVFEAAAIEQARLGSVPPRPLTHDLLASTVAALGATVLRVDIDAFQDSVFRAKLRLSQSGRVITLDARPSDSVALAVRTGAQIFAARRILADQGLSRADLERLRQNPRDLERRIRGEDAEGTRL
jgi:hypothetical protein